MIGATTHACWSGLARAAGAGSRGRVSFPTPRASPAREMPRSRSCDSRCHGGPRGPQLADLAPDRDRRDTRVPAREMEARRTARLGEWPTRPLLCRSLRSRRARGRARHRLRRPARARRPARCASARTRPTGRHPPVTIGGRASISCHRPRCRSSRWSVCELGVRVVQLEGRDPRAGKRASIKTPKRPMFAPRSTISGGRPSPSRKRATGSGRS